MAKKINLKKGSFNDWEGKVKVLIKYDGNEEYLHKILYEAAETEHQVGKGLHFDYTMYVIDGVAYCTVEDGACKCNRITRRVQFRLQNNRWIRKRKIRIHRENKWGVETLYYKDCK